MYGNACIDIAYPYATVFSPYYIGDILHTPHKISLILYRKDFAHPTHNISPLLYRKDFAYPTHNISPLLYRKDFAYPHAEYNKSASTNAETYPTLIAGASVPNCGSKYKLEQVFLIVEIGDILCGVRKMSPM